MLIQLGSQSHASRDEHGYLFAIVENAKKDKSEVLMLDANSLEQRLAAAQLNHVPCYSFYKMYLPKLFMDT